MKKKYFAISAFIEAFERTKNEFSPKNISLKKWIILSLFYYFYLFPFVPHFNNQYVSINLSPLLIKLFLFIFFILSVYFKSVGVFLFTSIIDTGKYEIFESIKKNMKLINNFFSFYFLSLFLIAIVFMVIFISLFTIYSRINSFVPILINFIIYSVIYYFFLFFLCNVVFFYFIFFDFVSIIMLKENIKTISAFCDFSNMFKKYSKEFIIYIAIKILYSFMYFVVIYILKFIGTFVVFAFKKQIIFNYFVIYLILSQILLPVGYFFRAYSLLFVSELKVQTLHNDK